MDKNKQLFADLMNLTSDSESFFFKDFKLDSETYRIFNYRLASWTEFQKPGAIDARGIMFNVTSPGAEFVVSMPPQKFFNYEEGGVDHSAYRFGDKMVKMDGSLISTYVHNDNVYLKSKASLFSDQALAAMKFLDLPENTGLKSELTKMVKEGWTFNMEYTSPENRIVIPYQSEDLTILSARNHETGENFFATKLNRILTQRGMVNSIKKMVKSESLHNLNIVHEKFVDDVRKEQEGEGYVVEVIKSEQESYLVKLKNIKYVTLHQTKDSVNSDKKLFESVIEEATDDLRSLFFDDQYVLDKIEAMEKKVRPIYNHIVSTVEGFYEKNKGLERKDYAIAIKKEHPEFLGLAMTMYLGNSPDFKDFAKKRRKELFGVEDIITDPEERVAKVEKRATP